jgi:CheY-like chemotaxis protein
MSDSLATRAPRVLLVDPDYRTSQRLAELLREDGFDVEAARDGAAAIGRLAHAPLLDALITELQLPLCDGVAVARFGRSQHPGLEVVVLTRHPDLMVAEAVESFSPLLLTKPVDYPRLLQALRATESTAAAASLTSSTRASA